MVSGGNTIVGDSPIAIDASGSSDPDGEPGGLSFAWACTPPPSGALAGALHPPIPGFAGCLRADGSAFAADQITGPAVSLALLGTPSGANYTIQVTVTKGGRAATASVWLSVRLGARLPVITIVGIAAVLFDPAEKLTLRATVASAYGLPGLSTAVSTRWSVVSPPELTDLLSRPGVSGTPLSSQSLVVSAGSLPPRTTVVFRLTAADAGGSTSADVSVSVAGTPTGLAGQALGGCSVSPPVGSGLNTSFSVAAAGWVDTGSEPLAFAFAYSVVGLDASLVRHGWLHPHTLPASRLFSAFCPALSDCVVGDPLQNAIPALQTAHSSTHPDFCPLSSSPGVPSGFQAPVCLRRVSSPGGRPLGREYSQPLLPRPERRRSNRHVGAGASGGDVERGAARKSCGAVRPCRSAVRGRPRTGEGLTRLNADLVMVPALRCNAFHLRPLSLPSEPPVPSRAATQSPHSAP